MLNKVFIMGRLAWTPELKATQSGVHVTSFRLAVDRDFKDENGAKATDWVDVVAWRQNAEFVSRYFTKGRTAVVEGRLEVRAYTAKDSSKRNDIHVVADHIYFGDSRSAEGADSGTPDQGQNFRDYQPDNGELPWP